MVTTAIPLDPSVSTFGNITGSLNVRDLNVTTTEQAPRGSVLIHPGTLADLLAGSDTIVLDRPQQPTEVYTTASTCERLVRGGYGALSNGDVQYLSRVSDLPKEDFNVKLLDLADAAIAVREAINERVQAFEGAEASEAGQINQQCALNGCSHDHGTTTADGNVVSDNVLQHSGATGTPESVYDAVQKFVDENEITGPGYLVPDVDVTDFPEDVLQEARERFVQNETDEHSPTFDEALFRSFVLEVARNLLYERFITELAAMVGFAKPQE